MFLQFQILYKNLPFKKLLSKCLHYQVLLRSGFVCFFITKQLSRFLCFFTNITVGPVIICLILYKDTYIPTMPVSYKWVILSLFSLYFTFTFIYLMWEEHDQRQLVEVSFSHVGRGIKLSYLLPVYSFLSRAITGAFAYCECTDSAIFQTGVCAVGHKITLMTESPGMPVSSRLSLSLQPSRPCASLGSGTCS